MRFNNETTIQELHDALAPIFERAEAMDCLTIGQEHLGAAIAIAVQHPESQTATDLLYHVEGCTAESVFEGARGTSLADWVATEDMHHITD